MPLRKLGKTSLEPLVVTNVKEMKEDAKEFGEKKRRSLGKRKLEEGSMPLRKPGKTSLEPLDVTNVKEMKEEAEEFVEKKKRLSDKGKFEEGSVTSADELSIRKRRNIKKDEGDSHSMRAESMIGKDGGTLDIQNTGVSLKIPPGALRHDYCVQMKIIPHHYLDETELSFASNSSVVVELLPNNVTLLKPATLTLPHCLVLKKKCGWKAKVYSSHHKEGNQPQWEEERNAHCDVTDETCVMWLDNFNWMKVQIGDDIVEAKKIILYAAMRSSFEDEIFIDIGYYWQLPSCRKVLNLNHAIVLHKIPVIFYKDGQLPLTILLEKVVPPNWTCNEGNNAKVIKFITVAFIEGDFCTFLLKKGVSDETDGCKCYFKAGQGSDFVDFKFSLKESSLSTTEVIIPSTGKATAEDTHEGLLSATEQIEDSDFSEESLQMPLRRLRRTLPEPFVTNTKEMKEDTKEVETNETRLSDKTGNIEKGSVTSVDQVSIRTDKNIIETDEGDCHSMRAESMIGKDGGTLYIQNTGVSLEIPPRALRRDYFVQMRIIPQHYRDETELPFTSYSSVVVELLPNNVKLLKPATLTIPHCLVLKRKCRWKAKVYSSHHKEGNQPQWKEERNTKCDVTYETCVMRLYNFCWKKFQIDGRRVEAMKITLFAAKRSHDENKIFLDIGYYWDLPSSQLILKLNHVIMLHEKPALFLKRRQLPLTVLLQKVFSPWTCNEENNAKIIKFDTVANMEADFCTFYLNKAVSDEKGGCLCFIKAGQGKDLAELKFSTNESSLSRAEAIILSTGNGIADSQEELPSAISRTKVRKKLLQKLSKKLTKRWREVGRNLKLTDDQLNILDLNYSDHQEKVYQMLLKWKSEKTIAATHGVLADALGNTGRVDLRDWVLGGSEPT
ncbi:uncharacterized protein [Apostichopus japonicus]|uniref:uncharacterized protein isoform X2 n=1 Tax=Stichopus japonicus TaxID=307972 RepID=UPI003AB7FA5F